MTVTNEVGVRTIVEFVAAALVFMSRKYGFLLVFYSNFVPKTHGF